MTKILLPVFPYRHPLAIATTLAAAIALAPATLGTVPALAATVPKTDILSDHYPDEPQTLKDNNIGPNTYRELYTRYQQCQEQLRMAPTPETTQTHQELYRVMNDISHMMGDKMAQPNSKLGSPLMALSLIHQADVALAAHIEITQDSKFNSAAAAAALADTKELALRFMWSLSKEQVSSPQYQVLNDAYQTLDKSKYPNVVEANKISAQMAALEMAVINPPKNGVYGLKKNDQLTANTKATLQSTIATVEDYLRQTPSAAKLPEYQELSTALAAAKQAKDANGEAAFQQLRQTLSKSFATLKGAVNAENAKDAATQAAATNYVQASLTVTSNYLEQISPTYGTGNEYQALVKQIAACKQAITSKQIKDMSTAKKWTVDLDDHVQALKKHIVAAEAERRAQERSAQELATKLATAFQTLKTSVANAQAEQAEQARAAAAARKAAVTYAQDALTIANAYRKQVNAAQQSSAEYELLNQQITACQQAITKQQITTLTAALTWTGKLNTAVQAVQRQAAPTTTPTDEPATTSSSTTDASTLNALQTLVTASGFLLSNIQDQHLSTTQNLPEYRNLLQVYRRAQHQLTAPGSDGETPAQLLSELQAARKALRSALLAGALAAAREHQIPADPQTDVPVSGPTDAPSSTSAVTNASPLTRTAPIEQHIPTTGIAHPDSTPGTVIGTATIRYAAGYGIQVWTRQGKLVRNPNGTAKKLRNGSKWHCFGKIVYIGRTKLYNLGGDQYVDAAYVNFTAK